MCIEAKFRPRALPLTASVKKNVVETSLCESEMFIQVYNCYLEGLIVESEKNASIGCVSGSVSPFHALRLPEITPGDYVKRLVQYTSCSTASLVTALIYIKRIQRNVGNLKGGCCVLDSFSVHRLLLACLVVAVKAVDDEIYDNAHYAKVGGLGHVKELNDLEMYVLKWITFDIGLSTEEFVAFEKEMIADVLKCDDAKWFNLRCCLGNLGYRKGVVYVARSYTGKSEGNIKEEKTVVARCNAATHAIAMESTLNLLAIN